MTSCTLWGSFSLAQISWGWGEGEPTFTSECDSDPCPHRSFFPVLPAARQASLSRRAKGRARVLSVVAGDRQPELASTTEEGGRKGEAREGEEGGGSALPVMHPGPWSRPPPHCGLLLPLA